MGEMRDSDWSRQNLLRSDWLLPRVATYTTNIICIDRGFAKPKEARYWRMQNDFPAEEKLPTEGGIKRTGFRSYSKDGIVYIGLI